MKKLLILSVLMSAAVVSAQTAPAALLTWVAPTTNTDGSALAGAVTYNVYQGLSTLEAKVVSGLSLTNYGTEFPIGSNPGKVCWYVTAVVAGIESGPSVEACKTFTTGVLTPKAPTGLTVK